MLTKKNQKKKKKKMSICLFSRSRALSAVLGHFSCTSGTVEAKKVGAFAKWQTTQMCIGTPATLSPRSAFKKQGVTQSGWCRCKGALT